ncbi:MAG: aminodeoxychorismate/anthranilate synthase component II [Myxococcaceae bacterium]
MSRPRVVILDNYDSYAYNILQRVGEITGEYAEVFRNDAISVGELAALQPTHLILSPGPGSPESPAYFGVCREAILQLGARVPVLGVCLGHQGIAAAFGGRIVRAPRVMHGKTSAIHHDGSALFAGLESPFIAMRYHSLIVEEASLPDVLEVAARSDDGLIMGLRHRHQPIHGVQFHPESIGTPDGVQLLRNFLGL